jgi:hypothetical protein
MKEKMKFIPMNLFINVGSLFSTFIILNWLCKFSLESSWIIAAIYYLEVVIQSSKHDYLEDKISKLEQRMPK